MSSSVAHDRRGNINDLALRYRDNFHDRYDNTRTCNDERFALFGREAGYTTTWVYMLDTDDVA